MKKIFLVLGMCLAMVASLAGCGSNGEAMSYDDYDLSEYIKVGQCEGLNVKPYTVSVTDDEIKADIDKSLEAAKETKTVKTGTIKKGDVANIDYVGKLNGKKFDGGSAKGTDLEIGSGQFIPGFEDGLVGKKIGETVDLNLTFPSNYGDSEIAGKSVVFTVTINSAKQQVKLSEAEYVKNKTNYKDVAEFEKAVKKKLTNQKEEKAIEEQKNSLWSDALDNTKAIKYPEREVEAYTEFNSKQIDDTAEASGVTREQVLQQYGFENEENFQNVNEDSSKLRIKQEMLIEWIAAKENLSYTDEEAENMLQQLEKSGYDKDKILKDTGRVAEDYIHIELLYEKVLDFLLENAKVSGSAKAY